MDRWCELSAPHTRYVPQIFQGFGDLGLESGLGFRIRAAKRGLFTLAMFALAALLCPYLRSLLFLVPVSICIVRLHISFSLGPS